MGLFKMLFPSTADKIEKQKKDQEAKKRKYEARKRAEENKSTTKKVLNNNIDSNSIMTARQKRKAEKTEFFKQQSIKKAEKRKKHNEFYRNGKKLILEFLKKEGTKLPASDIDFQLKIGNVDLVKKFCEEMYRDKEIGRTGNYRYFV
tara:strand:- start:76 stop:516 length:441 start_codon:yes stop_codon:yes gene_type:complete